MSNFTEMDSYLFGQATHYEIYEKLGAHVCKKDGKKGVIFDLWAPHAKQVFVIGQFNDWNETSHEMEKLGADKNGIFELFIECVKEESLYKYLIITEDGRKL